MAQRIFEIVDQVDGKTLFKLTADTDMRGIAVEPFPDWFRPVMIERFQSLMGEANRWLAENGVTE